MKKNQNSTFSLRRMLLATLVAGPLATLPAPLWALPKTALMTSSLGSTVSIQTETASSLYIRASDRAVLTWGNSTTPTGGTFDIGTGESVYFDLPSSSSAVLNKVVSSNVTTIDGSLGSNGSVYILNPNGITVTGGATINVVNLGLSTVDEPVTNFTSWGVLSYASQAALTGNVSFAPGTITAIGNGTVTLAGLNVTNVSGTIKAGALNIIAGNAASQGNVTLGGGTGLIAGNATAAIALNITANGTVDVAAVSSNITGNVTIATNGHDVNQTSATASATTVSNTLTINTINSNTSGTNGTVNLGTTASVLKNVVLNSGAASILSSSALTVANSTVNGALTLSSGANNLTVSSTTATGSIALTSTKAISFTGTGNLTFGSITSTTASGGNVTLTSTNGNVTIPTVSANVLTVTAATDIVQSGAITATTATFDAKAGMILLGNNTNSITNLVLKDAPTGATVNLASSTIVGNGTSVLGGSNTTITTTAGTIKLGNGSADVISIGGNLVLTATTGITEGSDNVTVAGSLTANTTTGAITLNGSLGNGLLVKNSYGAVSASTGSGDITIFEYATLNLANITTTGNLTAISTGGNIINSGIISVGNLIVGAGTAAAPGDITLTYVSAGNVSNSIATGGAIYIQDDNSLLNKTSVLANATTTVGTLLARNVSITTSSNLTMGNATSSVTPTVGIGNLTLSYIGAGSGGITSANNTVVNGSLSLNSTGTVNVSNASVGTVNVTAAGSVSTSTTGNSVINANLTGASSNATFASGGVLTIGSVSSNRTTDTANSTGYVRFSSTKDMKDSVTGGIQIYGATTFASGGNLSITKGGNSVGAVTLSSAASSNGNITYVEGATVNLASVSVNGTGSLSITSGGGDIIQLSGATAITMGNTTKASSFTASSGNVFLSLANTLGVVSASAAGNVTVFNSGNVALDKISVPSGFLLVNSTSGTITQTSSGSVYVYGQLALQTANKDITLTNASNRFGAYYINAGAGNITITEDTTINLQSVSTSGNLTLTSGTGSIMDSVGSSLTIGSTWGNTPANVTFAAIPVSAGTSALTSLATFTATKGNISLTNSNNALNALSINTTGNATIMSNATAGSALVLTGAAVGGDLTLKNLNVGGAILQTGALAVTGNASFSTNTSNTSTAGAVILSNASNQLGNVSFVSGNATIVSAKDLVLRPGSVAVGTVVLTTTGNFSTAGVGGSSISGTLAVNAGGNITFGAGSILVTNGLTVNATGVKDVSKLSYFGNLNGKAVLFQGSTGDANNLKPYDNP